MSLSNENNNDPILSGFMNEIFKNDQETLENYSVTGKLNNIDTKITINQQVYKLQINLPDDVADRYYILSILQNWQYDLSKQSDAFAMICKWLKLTDHRNLIIVGYNDDRHLVFDKERLNLEMFIKLHSMVIGLLAATKQA